MNSNAALPNRGSQTDFCYRAEQRLKNATPGEMALVALDFDNFKYINDLFGYETGDRLLELAGEHFASALCEGELVENTGSDNFAFLVYSGAVDKMASRFMRMTAMGEWMEGILPTHYNLTYSGGVYFIEGTEKIETMLDSANFARKQAKGYHQSKFLKYDKVMSDELHWKKEITIYMESALQNREFEMYLQPKTQLKSGKLMGAEALVRWNKKNGGTIFPDRFIPVFEQNGFIKLLDFYMLEEACKFITSCRKRGLPVLPISVNFSKLHIGTKGIVDRIYQTARKYGVPPHLIEIELTESAFSQDFQRLVEIASGLKYLGFKVSLDDFGSGYSSLNYLKDLPVDIIKIDKGFLDITVNTQKGRLIIAKMVELIKSLRLTTVMEGVETLEQVEFLQRLSCDIAQGYYYARPMPAEAYVEYLNGCGELIFDGAEPPQESESLKASLYDIPKEFEMDNWELYILGQNIDMGLMKGVLDEEATIQYVNKRALEYLGYTAQEFRETFGNKITAFSHPDDAELIRENAKLLVETGEPITFKSRAVRKDGKIINLQGRASCVIDNSGTPIGLYAFQDVTDDLENTDRLKASLEERSREIASFYSGIPCGIIHCTAMGDYELIHFNKGFLSMVECDSMELWDRFGGKLVNLIAPEDVCAFEKWVQAIMKDENAGGINLCFIVAGGRRVKAMVRGRIACNDEGNPKLCCVMMDVSNDDIVLT